MENRMPVKDTKDTIQENEDRQNALREEHRQHKIRDNTVHKKAEERAQLTFTLMEQDKSSPITIAFWIMANMETAPADKLRGALDTAILMRTFKKRHFAD
jgi:hypothetical protein